MLRQRQKEKERMIIIVTLLVVVLITPIFCHFYEAWQEQRQAVLEELGKMLLPSEAEKRLNLEYLGGLREPDGYYHRLSDLRQR